jgi:RNase P subunit RPR2
MPNDFVSLISYIDADELQELKKQLEGNRIKYIVNKQGATAAYIHSNYYEIKVPLQDYDAAKAIANRFKATRFVKSRKCPKCKSPLYDPVTKLNFFQKILYLGTTPVQCRKCGTKYVF